jgi:alpha-tubulin suppressor-like RCC1 family protein/type II secretory pathway pseudopilin PulG
MSERTVRPARHRRGLGLVELMVSIVIVSVLAASTVAISRGVLTRADRQQTAADLGGELNTALAAAVSDGVLDASDFGSTSATRPAAPGGRSLYLGDAVADGYVTASAGAQLVVAVLSTMDKDGTIYAVSRAFAPGELQLAMYGVWPTVTPAAPVWLDARGRTVALAAPVTPAGPSTPTTATAPPTAVNDSVATTPGATATVEVRGNDADPGGNIATATISLVGPVDPRASVFGTSISYEVPANATSSITVRYRLKSAVTGLSDTASVLFTVTADGMPVAVADRAWVKPGATVAIAVRANDTDPDGDISAATVTVIGSPGAGTTAASGGTVTYTNTGGVETTDTFTYRLTAENNKVSTAVVTVTVSNDDQSPIAVNDSVTLDQAATSTVPVLNNDSDPDGTTGVLRVEIISPPKNGAAAIIDPNDTTDGVLRYTPRGNFVGADEVTYRITDRTGLSDTARVAFTVRSIGMPPVAVNDTAFTAPGVVVVIPVRANDSDPDGELSNAELSLVAGPTNGAITATSDAAGTMSYQSDPLFNSVDSFTYLLRDEQGLTATATVTVNVTVPPQPPVANPDLFTVLRNGSGARDAKTNDTDPDGDIALATVSTMTTPTNGAVVRAGSTYTYTPNAGFFGTDSFTYRLTDVQGMSDTTTVTVRVLTIPVAVNDSFNVLRSTATAINVKANDADDDAGTGPLTVNVTSGPTNGAYNPTTGVYTPTGAYFGADSFTYTLTDADGQTSNQATVSIMVQAPPIAVNDSVMVAHSQVSTFNLKANDSDPDGNIANATITLVTSPTRGTFNPTTGQYTHGGAAGATDSFTYRLTDEQGLTATATVSVAIKYAPVAVDDVATLTEGTSITLDPKANDSDLDTPMGSVAFALVTSPTLGTFDTTTWLYQSTNGMYGVDAFAYTLTDPDGLQSSATITITVTESGAPIPVLSLSDSGSSSSTLTCAISAADQQLYCSGTPRPAPYSGQWTNLARIANPSGAPFVSAHAAKVSWNNPGRVCAVTTTAQAWCGNRTAGGALTLGRVGAAFSWKTVGGTWGLTTAGQIYRNLSATPSVPGYLGTPPASFTKLSIDNGGSGEIVCAVGVDKSVWCNGGGSVMEPSGVAGGGPTAWSDVTVLGNSVCAVADDVAVGSVWCKGNSLGSEAAYNPYTNSYALSLKTVLTRIDTTAKAAAITGAPYHNPPQLYRGISGNCAVNNDGTLRDGEVWCLSGASYYKDTGRARIDRVENDACFVGLDTYAECRGLVVADSGTPRRYYGIDAYGDTTCARDAAGRGWCWGGGDSGKLGNGDVKDHFTVGTYDGGVVYKGLHQPVALNADVKLTDISVGGEHACAITTTGRWLCWGGGSAGATGIGSFATKTRPTPTATGATTFVEVAAGGYFTCARTTAGAVWCTGSDNGGVLGRGGGAVVPPYINAATPAPITTAGVPATWTSVTAGRSHACGTATSGAAWCWGDNFRGALGDGTTTDSATPVQVRTETISGFTSWRSLDAGGSSTCGIAQHNGRAYCWGDDGYGQLGDQTTLTHSSVPLLVADVPLAERPTTYTSVHAGSYAVCATTTTMDVYCWGDNGTLAPSGTAAVNPTALRNMAQPRTVASVQLADSVAVGTGPRGINGGAVCVAGLYTWCGTGATMLTPGIQQERAIRHPFAVTGASDDRATTRRDDPVTIDVLANDISGVGFNTGTVTVVVAPARGAVAPDGVGRLRYTPTMSTTGTDRFTYRVTDNDGVQHTAVVRVGITQAPRGATGDRHTCMLFASAVHCAGQGQYGVLGHGLGEPESNSNLDTSTSPFSGPTLNDDLPMYGPAALASATAVAAGRHHSCALAPADGVYCWGRDQAQQLGNGSTTTSAVTPTKVSGTGTITYRALDASGDMTCALDNIGTPSCWGTGYLGQTGAVNMTVSDVPRAVNMGTAPVSGYVAISVGPAATCMLTGEGHPTAPRTIWCFGENIRNVLGHGTPGLQNTPAKVTHSLNVGGTPAAGLPTSWVSVAVGRYVVCGVEVSGNGWCWGNNKYEPTQQSLVSDPDAHIVDVDQNFEQSCVLSFEGILSCGYLNNLSDIGPPSAFQHFSPGSGLMAGSSTYTAAGSSNGLRVCVGAQGHGTTGPGVGCAGDGSGQDSALGAGRPSGGWGFVVAPVTMLYDDPRYTAAPARLGNFTHIASSSDRTCVLSDNKSMWCWGGGGGASATIPDQIDTITGTVESPPSPADTYTGLIDGGLCRRVTNPAPAGLQCMTYYGFPQVYTELEGATVGYTRRSTNPLECHATSSRVACRLYQENTGFDSADYDAMLGKSPRGPNRQAFENVTMPFGATGSYTSIASGDKHVCAVRGIALYCWGDNTLGQLGDGTTTTRPNPVQVIGAVTSWKSVFARGQTTCAIATNNAVYCWGDNSYWKAGADGLGGNPPHPASVSTPTRINAISGSADVTSIAMADSFTCANPGTAITCWGTGGLGAANGPTRPSDTRDISRGGSGHYKASFMPISAGDKHVCYIGPRAVYCYGSNDRGELGSTATAPVDTSSDAWPVLFYRP